MPITGLVNIFGEKQAEEFNNFSNNVDRRQKVHRALQNFGLATAGASIASPLTSPITETAGGISDFIDGTLYLLEKQYGDAALSYAAIAPFVGGLAAAKRVGKSLKTTDVSYRGSHQPRGPEFDDAVRLDDLTMDISGRPGGYPKDIYGPRGQEFYARGPKQGWRNVYGIANDESYRSVMKFKNNPDAEVIIHRAVPKGVNVINEGDFVTLSPQYAKIHAEQYVDTFHRGVRNTKAHVISKKVKVKDVYWDGNDINEFGYFPKKNKKIYQFEDLPNTRHDDLFREIPKKMGQGKSLYNITTGPPLTGLQKVKRGVK